MSSPALFATLGSAVSTLIGLVLEIGLLVVALTVVRRRRADAGALIAASSGISLALLIISPLAYAGIARFVGVGGTDDYMRASMMLQIVMALIRGAAFVLLIFGIFRLATAPPQDTQQR